MPSGISVVVPAYNRADLIGHTLRSLLRQTVPADEIIVVDDGSTDGTVEAVLEMLKLGNAEKLKWSGGRPWPEFKVLQQANAGPGAARNRGLAEAEGEFIHFFDSDDLAAPNKHEVQAHALREGADIAFGPWVKGCVEPLEKLKSGHADMLKDRALVTAGWRFLPSGRVFQQHGLPQGDLVEALVSRWSTVPQACMFRRKVLEESGGFPPQMFAAEDQVLFLRCLLRGAKVVHTPATITFYRLGHEGKLTDSTEGHRRRLRDWARFLVMAHEEISASQRVSVSAFSATKSLRYRQRCHAAWKDLAAIGEADTELARKLERLAGPGTAVLEAAGRLRRWAGGVKARLTGCREDDSFRTGPMTAAQAALFPSDADDG